MHRGYMAALLAGLGGDVRKSVVHRELRAMGLKKGVLTGAQARASLATTAPACSLPEQAVARQRVFCCGNCLLAAFVGHPLYVPPVLACVPVPSWCC